jgi:hypothetical protein
MEFSKIFLFSLLVIGMGFTQYVHGDNITGNFTVSVPSFLSAFSASAKQNKANSVTAGVCAGAVHALFLGGTLCLGKELGFTSYIKMNGDHQTNITAARQHDRAILGTGATGLILGAVPANTVAEYLHPYNKDTTETLSYWATCIAITCAILKAHQHFRPQ